MDLRLSIVSVLLAACLGGCASAGKTDAQEDGIIYTPVEAGTSGIISREKTVLKKPANYMTGNPEMVTFSDDVFECVLYAKEFAQGNAVYAEFIYKDDALRPKKVTFIFNGENAPLTATSWGYRSIVAINAEQKPGELRALFLYNAEEGTGTVPVTLRVRDVKFPVSKNMLDLGRFSDEGYLDDPGNKELIKKSQQLIRHAYESDTEDHIGNALSHPRNFHKITGGYWNKRTYLSYKKTKKKKIKRNKTISFHRGVDLKGETGAPVYAMADGVVVLSGKMFFEGNMVMIDHGNKVFSYYMHMDSFSVREGERVTAGQQIGKVGSTGTSTGPHLHVALRIRGVHVDPLSFLWLPVKR